MEFDKLKSTGLQIALTGATGYVGGMLLSPLSEIAAEVVCLSRNPDRLRGSLPGNARAVKADTTDLDSLKLALQGCDVAFYLVHSLAENADFFKLETESAERFAAAARSVGVRRIIYLGALAQDDGGHTSAHMESRHRVGEILKSTGVPVTELRASVIIGPGSMPFEAIRSLVERLPVMVTPRWVRKPVQPIAAPDLVRYLVSSVSETGTESHVYEIGGSEVTTYAGLMNQYAKFRGLRRFMIPVPVITPRLSSLWLKLVTPAHYRIGRRIVDSAAHSSIVADDQARHDFKFETLSVREAIEEALKSEIENLAFLDEPFSTDAEVEKIRTGTMFVERRSVVVTCDEASANEVIQKVGGTNGWFWGDWLWKLRGALDRAVSGPGMRVNETKYPLRQGSVLDLWSVERVSENVLVLRADMKLPGRAWMKLSTRRVGSQVHVDQIAAFDPKGLGGVLYWFTLYPLHALVFAGMLRGIKRKIETPAKAHLGARDGGADTSSR